MAVQVSRVFQTMKPIEWRGRSVWPSIKMAWRTSERLKTENGKRNLNGDERKGCSDDPNRCSPNEAECSSRTIGSEFARRID
jgi:hypothetical protein